MAESACLRRSFSNPTEVSHEFQEGDPLRALGESISFGRYMSESLAWEKWSTFSNNRYLEEAEKYSKPGSVAKMKAYFEAHYNRIGAKKCAVQELTENEPSDGEPEVQDTIGNSPSLNTEKTLANGHTTICEFPDEDTPDEELLSSVIVSSCDSFTPINELQAHELQAQEVNVVESGVTVDTTDDSMEVQVRQCKDAEVHLSVSESSAEIKVNELVDTQESDIIASTPERILPVKKEVEKGNLDSRSKLKSVDSSLKRSMKSNISKLSSSLARLATPVRPKKEGSDTPNNIKSGKESLNKKKPTSRLVHMSTNYDVRKTSPAARKTEIGKVFTPLGKMIRDRFTPSPAPSRASVNCVSRHPSATPQSETRRSKIALEKSFSRGRTLDKKFQSPSAGNTNSLVQSPTTFSSFSFRTEERAAKRREFLQKRLEKEAENLQLLEKAKVKPKAEIRKSSQCVNLRANVTLDFRTEVLSDSTKKIASTRTQLPKCGTKPASELAQMPCPRPPQRSISSKLGAEMRKPVPTESSILQSKKKRHENASPNILRR